MGRVEGVVMSRALRGTMGRFFGSGRWALAGNLLAGPVVPDDLSPRVTSWNRCWAWAGVGCVVCVGCFGKFFLAGARGAGAQVNPVTGMVKTVDPQGSVGHWPRLDVLPHTGQLVPLTSQ